MYPPLDAPVNAVKAICASIKDGGRFDRADICKRLEERILQGVGCTVAFSYRMSEAHRLPQLYRKRPHIEKVNIICFIQTNSGEDSIFVDTLRQMSIATVLAVSPMDFVDTLSPDETYTSFSRNYHNYSLLSQSVYDTLVEAISDFPSS